jgi:hypothetical protein
LQIKLNVQHFHKIEAMETESQAVLNTLTEDDFQNSFKKTARALGNWPTRRRRLLRLLCWPIDQKVVFDQLVASVPEIMDDSLQEMRINDVMEGHM